MDSNAVRAKHKEFLFPCVANYYAEPVVIAEAHGAAVTDAERDERTIVGLTERIIHEAAAGGRVDERVAAGGDGRPAARLSGRRRLERRLEPGSNGGGKERERVAGNGGGHGTASIPDSNI